MIAAIHQPAYLPWLGYLDRIARADVFIYLDTVQFEKNSFTNRNRIKTANGPVWLTIPVRGKGHLDGTIKTLEIDTSKPWAKKHLRSITQAYGRAPDAQAKLATLEATYAGATILADLCFNQLLFWCSSCGITTKIIRASELQSIGQKADLVVNLCEEVGATAYLSGPFGHDYLDPQAFADRCIALHFHDFEHPQYPQLHGTFIPGMGIVDYWMTGDSAWTPGGMT